MPEPISTELSDDYQARKGGYSNCHRQAENSTEHLDVCRKLWIGEGMGFLIALFINCIYNVCKMVWRVKVLMKL